MDAITICNDFGAQEEKKVVTVSIFFPSICHEVMGPDAMVLVFWMLSLKPAFSLSSFTFIKRLFSSSLLFSIIVVSSVYLRLLTLLYTILIPAFDSSPWLQVIWTMHSFWFCCLQFCQSTLSHLHWFLPMPYHQKKSGEMPRFFFLKSQWLATGLQIVRKNKVFISLLTCKKYSGAFCVSNLGYSAHGIFLARILEWVAMHSSRESSRPRDQICHSCISCAAGMLFTWWAIGKPRFFFLLSRFWPEQDKSGVSWEELYDKDG